MANLFGHYVSRLIIYMCLVEYLILFTSMFIVFNLDFMSGIEKKSSYFVVLSGLIFSSTTSLSALSVGFYNRKLSKYSYEIIKRLIISYVISFFILLLIYYIFPEATIPGSILVLSILISCIAILITRVLFNKFTRMEEFKTRILVFGCGKIANSLTPFYQKYDEKDFMIVGFYDTGNEQVFVDESLLVSSTQPLSSLSRDLNIDEIVIALDDRSEFLPFDELLDCKVLGIQVMELLSFYEKEERLINLEYLNPYWFLFSKGFYNRKTRGFIKRAVDIVASLLLLMTSSPVIMLAILAIYLESLGRGSIFYSQNRVGLNGVCFKLYKFRSMIPQAEVSGIKMTSVNDSRITRVGAFLRKYRIDELPQILNILKGDMHFIGPRPERPEFVNDFNKRIVYYHERHRVKPGLTGWAQLCYSYGSNEYDTIQKLQYDLYYVKNQSFFLDLTIILQTVEVILFGKGSR